MVGEGLTRLALRYASFYRGRAHDSLFARSAFVCFFIKPGKPALGWIYGNCDSEIFSEIYFPIQISLGSRI